MLETVIADFFKSRDWKWSIKGKGRVVPDEEDIEKALDEAARVLYNQPEGTRLEVGRLIIEKRTHGHDVYMYVGEYY